MFVFFEIGTISIVLTIVICFVILLCVNVCLIVYCFNKKKKDENKDNANQNMNINSATSAVSGVYKRDSLNPDATSAATNATSSGPVAAAPAANATTSQIEMGHHRRPPPPRPKLPPGAHVQAGPRFGLAGLPPAPQVDPQYRATPASGEAGTGAITNAMVDWQATNERQTIALQQEDGYGHGRGEGNYRGRDHESLYADGRRVSEGVDKELQTTLTTGGFAD